jgi:autotransporter-associated beta strand protein/probable HAF family extracellular repeat protein
MVRGLVVLFAARTVARAYRKNGTRWVWRGAGSTTAAVVICQVAAVPAAAQTYTYTTINNPSATATIAWGINNAGQIVGDDSSNRGFLYSGGVFTPIAVPQAISNTVAFDINNAGQIVGAYNAGAAGFLYSGGIYTSLSRAAYGINDSGVIVGYTPNSATNTGYIYSGGIYTSLSVPGSVFTFPTGINDKGQIVGGWSNPGAGVLIDGFLYSNGVFTTLNVPGSTYTNAWGINEEGQIVGDYADASGVHPFRYSNGVYVTLVDPLLTNLAYAQGINDFGQIVGQYYNPLANAFLANPNPFPFIDLAGSNLTIGSLAGAGLVTNSGVSSPATLTVGGDNSSTTFSGVIQDGNSATALTKVGSGTLMLSGVNTYSGATNINAGTLQGGASNAFSPNSAVTIASGALLDLGGFNQTIASVAGAGTVTNGGVSSPAALTAGGDNSSTTFSGVIQDGTSATALIKVGSGTLTLSGANTYSGATNINAGAVRGGASNTFSPNSAVTIASGALLDLRGFNQTIGSLTGTGTVTNSGVSSPAALTAGGDNSSTTFSGVIQDGTSATALTKTGAGTLTLSGANSYTGLTSIVAGTLALSGTSIASSSGVLDLGTFDISATSAGATIGTLSGNGIVRLGSRTLTISNGSTGFSGAINGSGGLTLSAGTLVLAGINTYSGPTAINGGTLDIAGSIASSSLTSVNSGATLAGAGAVGNLQVNAGGVFAPGNGAPGSSMIVSGNLAFQSAALYLVQINPSTASFVSVTGTATLGGAKVNAVFSSGSYVAKQYAILTAGNVGGTFDPASVNTNLPSGFKTTLSYDATHAYLDLSLVFIPPPGTGLNGNQQNVANAIVNFFNSNGSIPLVWGGLTAPGLTQLSGENTTAAQQTTFSAMNQFMGVLTDPFVAGRGDPIGGAGGPAAYADETLAYAAKRPADAFALATKAPPLAPRFDQRWSVWASGFGGSQRTDGNTALGSNDTRSSIYGTAVGADYRLSPDTLAGFALAGGGTNFSVNGLGSGRSDLFQAGGFIRHNIGAAYLSGALAYGWQDITTDRIVTIAGLDRLRAEFNANAWSGRAEGGYRFVTAGFGITPYAAGQFTSFGLPAYVEQAIAGTNTFALAYGGKSVTDSRSELGLRADKAFAVQGGILTLRGRVAWAHDFNPDRSLLATFRRCRAQASSPTALRRRRTPR